MRRCGLDSTGSELTAVLCSCRLDIGRCVRLRTSNYLTSYHIPASAATFCFTELKLHLLYTLNLSVCHLTVGGAFT